VIAKIAPPICFHSERSFFAPGRGWQTRPIRVTSDSFVSVGVFGRDVPSTRTVERLVRERHQKSKICAPEPSSPLPSSVCVFVRSLINQVKRTQQTQKTPIISYYDPLTYSKMMEIDSIVSTLQAMRRQEETGYVVDDDFLGGCSCCCCDPDESDDVGPMATRCGGGRQCGPLHERDDVAVNDDESAALFAAPVDANCRNKISIWCYQVADFAKFRRETVEIAMNYLDRYVASPGEKASAARHDRETYQLAAMTALYTAIKIHEQEAIQPKFVSKLSRGAFSPEQVEEMELSMVQTIGWKLNPPTALSFARMFLALVPSDVLDDGMKQSMFEVAKYQTELAVNEYELVSVRPSTIAFCSLLNALESLAQDSKMLSYVGCTWCRVVEQDYDQVFRVQNSLYEAVMGQPTAPGVLNLLSVDPHRHHHYEYTSALSSSICHKPSSISAFFPDGRHSSGESPRSVTADNTR